MSAANPRSRRWSSRLNNMANNNNNNNHNSISTTTPTNASGVSVNQGYEQMCYGNFVQTENRLIYETPDVALRPLAFYDLVYQLIKPSGLISDGVAGRAHESTVEFTLSVEQADMVGMSLNRKQILLRFCHYAVNSEQDDNFPPDVVIAVNGANVTLPPATPNPNKPNLPPKRPGQHVDITRHCKICPFISNQVCVKWSVDPTEPNRSYVINIILAEKVETEVLLERIRDRGMSSAELAKKLILDSDNEVATMNLQTSLVCPLGKMRMSLPCKSINCQHIPCFDASVYMQMNEKRATWICPVCYKPAYYRDLMIDGFFMDILNNTSPDVTEITLNLDGTWSPIVKMEQAASAEKPPPEIITISDDDD